MDMQKIIASLRQLLNGESEAPVPQAQKNEAPNREPTTAAPPSANLHIVLDAITQACSQFVQQHVRPIADYQPDMGYAIRTIRLRVTPANARLIQDMSRMNPAARDMLVASCVRKAVGSALISLDDFYGLTLDGDDAMLEGQVVKVLRCNDESFQPLHFVFDGEYKVIPFTRDPTPSLQAGQMDTDPAPIASAASRAGNELQLQEPLLPERITNKDWQASKETILARPGTVGGAIITEPVGQERPQAALAYLRIRDARGDERVVPIDRLPFAIGREHQEAGYEADEQYLHVSRLHLRLAQRQGSSGFLVDNLAAERNGTYCQGQPQAARFVWSIANRESPHQDQGWLTLGCRNLGSGSLQVRLEHAELATASAA